VLKQRSCWALLDVTGWTIPRISEKFSIPEEAVKKGIRLFRERLPDEKLIPARFRPLVSLLRGTSDLRDRKRFWYARGFLDPAFRFPARNHRIYLNFPLSNNIINHFSFLGQAVSLEGFGLSFFILFQITAMFFPPSVSKFIAH
jgi:hypothetical protein